MNGLPLRLRGRRATTRAGMTAAAATNPSESIANPGGSAPAGWQELRADGNLLSRPEQLEFHFEFEPEGS